MFPVLNQGSKRFEWILHKFFNLCKNPIGIILRTIFCLEKLHTIPRWRITQRTEGLLLIKKCLLSGGLFGGTRVTRAVSWQSALGADFSDSSEEPDHSYDHLSPAPHGPPYVGGHAIKAEVKLFVRARDSGKEAVEIRSIREFVDLSTTVPASSFGEAAPPRVPSTPRGRASSPRGDTGHHALKSQPRGDWSGPGTKKCAGACVAVNRDNFEKSKRVPSCVG